jgi:hypothetical protein
VAFVRVRVLANAQRIKFCLKSAAIDDFGRCELVSHDVLHLSPLCCTG